MSTLSPSGGSRHSGRTGTRPAVLALALVVVVLAASTAVYLIFLRDSASTVAAACPTPTPTAVATASAELPAPATIAVRVLNTTNRSGLAKAVADELTKRGFAVGEVTNAPAGTVVPGVAEVRFAAQGEASAKVVAAQVGAPASATPATGAASAAAVPSGSAVPTSPAAPSGSAAPGAAPVAVALVGTGAPGAGVDLLLGQAFDSLLTVAAAAAVLAPPPPAPLPAGCTAS